MEESVWLNSVQTLGTTDGPGIRTVLFFQGCPLRCSYCHNPETWPFREGMLYFISSLLELVKEYRPYYTGGGGVTASGGECLFQADFLLSFLRACRELGIHTAVDTSGMVGLDTGSAVQSAVDGRKLKSLVFKEADLVILDVKFNTEEDYRRHTGGTLAETLETLSILEEIHAAVWIRQVILPGINDSHDAMRRLKKNLSRYHCVEKVELLPFRKICLEKYERLGREFPFQSKPETDPVQVDALQRYYDALD